LSDDNIARAVLAWAEPRHLDQAHLDRWLALDAYSAAAILDAASHLRLHVGQLRSALEMLEEIALIEGTQVSAVLARAPLKRIFEGVGPASARARAFVDELRTMRFPRLACALEQLKAKVAELKLPRTVCLALPKDLGSDELRIEIRVRSAGEFKDSLRKLVEKADDVERILDLLGGGNFTQEFSNR
jgi:hypothetical protein